MADPHTDLDDDDYDNYEQLLQYDDFSLQISEIPIPFGNPVPRRSRPRSSDNSPPLPTKTLLSAIDRTIPKVSDTATLNAPSETVTANETATNSNSADSPSSSSPTASSEPTSSGSAATDASSSSPSSSPDTKPLPPPRPPTKSNESVARDERHDGPQWSISASLSPELPTKSSGAGDEVHVALEIWPSSSEADTEQPVKTARSFTETSPVDVTTRASDKAQAATTSYGSVEQDEPQRSVSVPLSPEQPRKTSGAGDDVQVDLEVWPTSPGSRPLQPEKVTRGFTGTSQVDATISQDNNAQCKPFVLHPASSTPEPFRDVRGPVTLYRLVVVCWVVGVVWGLYALQALIWPPDERGLVYQGEWYAHAEWSYVLLITLAPAVLVFAGSVWYAFDPDLDSVKPMAHGVVFRIVSRGLNNECLLETIRSIQGVMRRNSYFPYLIEVVTEAGVFHAPVDDIDVCQLHVPADFHTPNGTMHKARALHYTVLHSPVPDNAWVVHLDEETHVASSAVKGIAKFVSNAEHRGDYNRVGQGGFLFHRGWRRFPLLTLADMRRTGDDFGPFFLQHRLGFTVFGLHGAFVVVRQSTERAVGWDVGPRGSVTEDAWWALVAMQAGVRFGWVHGFLIEQAPQSLGDLIAQRHRWLYGNLNVAFHSPVRFRYRFCYSIALTLWFIAPFVAPLQITYIVLLITHHLPVPLGTRLATLFIVATQLWQYAIGWVANIREGLPIRWYTAPLWSVALLLLYPAFQLIETYALLKALCTFVGLVKNGRGFHVVKKSALGTDLDGERRVRQNGWKLVSHPNERDRLLV